MTVLSGLSDGGLGVKAPLPWPLVNTQDWSGSPEETKITLLSTYVSSLQISKELTGNLTSIHLLFVIYQATFISFRFLEGKTLQFEKCP